MEFLICEYTKCWLQFSLPCLTHVSIKGSGLPVCISFLLMTSPCARPNVDCYHKLLPVYSTRLSFLRSSGSEVGIGERFGWGN